MTKKLNYTVRNVGESLGVKPTGLWEDLGGNYVRVVNSSEMAIVTMLTDFNEWSRYRQSKTIRWMNPDVHASATNEFTFIDLDMFVQLTSTPKTLAETRSAITDTISTWAEKCRVKGLRGWRLNAVRSLSVKKVPGGLNSYRIQSKVILNNAIVYNSDEYEMYDPKTHLAEDLKNLDRKLKKIPTILLFDMIGTEST